MPITGGGIIGGTAAGLLGRVAAQQIQAVSYTHLDVYKRQFQASLENTREQMERDALTAVMTGALPEEGFDLQLERLQEMAEEYAAAAQVIATNPEGSEAAMEAQDTQGRLLAEAQVMAQNEYNASEGAQILLDSQLMLAETVAADTSADETYYNAGQRLGNKYTEGIAAAIRNAKLPSPTLPSVSTAMWAQDTFSLYTPGQYKSSAIGENRVPRDNMPVSYTHLDVYKRQELPKMLQREVERWGDEMAARLGGK